jgi:prepilin-type N-terminal cleavage/methylation domain-containing protein
MKKKKNQGITLIELIIVISIIGIITVALGFEFVGWMGRYRVESQTKEMYVDLMNTRVRALQKNRTHFVTLTATQYTIQEDIDPWPDGNGSLTAADSIRPAGYNDPIPFLQRNLDAQCPITWSGGAQITFSARGLSLANSTVCSNTDDDADYDCIEISASRINLGKLTTMIPDGGACDSTNCVAR